MAERAAQSPPITRLPVTDVAQRCVQYRAVPPDVTGALQLALARHRPHLKRIARLAEPYPPLPRTDENPDILHVTRTWQFLPDGALVDE